MNCAEVCALSLDYRTRDGIFPCLKDVSFQLPEGRTTALVGESGSGKSTIGGLFLGLRAKNATVHPESAIKVHGRDILSLTTRELRSYRWVETSMVFQASSSSLNPLRTIGKQADDILRAHPHSPSFVLEEMLERVRLDPERVPNLYPHELSGGMRQRVLIAFALLLKPRLVVLDEPTTALDLITQVAIFQLLETLQSEHSFTTLLITHDLSAVARLAHRVVVLREGVVVEDSDVESLFYAPTHDYTKELLQAAPRLEVSL